MVTVHVLDMSRRSASRNMKCITMLTRKRHIQKHMGGAVQDYKRKKAGTKLSDGKTVG